MFAWSQLEFFAIPVSISAGSLTGRQTWQNVNSKRRLQRIQNRKEKDTSSCFCRCPSVFGEKFPTSAETSYQEEERK
jgi:hypothetical protein